MSCCFFLGTLRDLLLRCWEGFCLYGVVQVDLLVISPLGIFLYMAMLWASPRMLRMMLWSCGMVLGIVQSCLVCVVILECTVKVGLLGA